VESSTLSVTPNPADGDLLDLIRRNRREAVERRLRELKLAEPGDDQPDEVWLEWNRQYGEMQTRANRLLVKHVRRYRERFRPATRPRRTIRPHARRRRVPMRRAGASSRTSSADPGDDPPPSSPAALRAEVRR
jgi:hypothetical protein